MIHVGFTGTRHGMSPAQIDAVVMLVRQLSEVDQLTAHHGDCVGADEDFHDIVTQVDARIVVHPPSDEKLRTFCERADEWRPACTHLARNRCIVHESTVMIATPFERTHRAYGGTWYTVDYAKKTRRPLALVLPAPSGTMVEFSGEHVWPSKKKEEEETDGAR